MKRRSLLLAGLGAAGGQGFLRGPISVDAAETAVSPLSAEIEIDGRTFRYQEANALDLGDYTDPLGRFVQTCKRATDPGLPMGVMFRRDRGSDRAEVIFELGLCWSGEPAHLGRYRARILRGSTDVAVVDVPNHYWFSRWRWQSALRPVRVTTVSLMQQGLLPSYDARAHTARSIPVRPQSYEPMGLAGVTAYFGTTGDRDDIGPVTEAQAEYLCTGRSAALSTLMAQGEAAGTVPWIMRDEKTGGPVDVLAYPKVSSYSAKGGTPYIATVEGPVYPDSAHQPALAYVPFLLTGDPYHLESLQFQATWNIVSQPWPYRYRVGQVRAHAWSLRTLGQAAAVTPSSVPKWLLPRAHWKQLLDMQRDWLTHDLMESKEPAHAIFRTINQELGRYPMGDLPAATTLAPWQDDFEAFSAGWLVRMGFPEWLPYFRWQVDSQISRTNGRSGWVRAHCTPFMICIRKSPDGPWASSWKEAWGINQAAQHFQVSDPNRWQDEFFTLPFTRGVLALARHADIPEAEECFAWADSETARAAATDRHMSYRWALV